MRLGRGSWGYGNRRGKCPQLIDVPGPKWLPQRGTIALQSSLRAVNWSWGTQPSSHLQWTQHDQRLPVLHATKNRLKTKTPRTPFGVAGRSSNSPPPKSAHLASYLLFQREKMALSCEPPSNELARSRRLRAATRSPLQKGCDVPIPRAEPKEKKLSGDASELSQKTRQQVATAGSIQPGAEKWCKPWERMWGPNSSTALSLLPCAPNAC